jgi:hypothetical protein
MIEKIKTALQEFLSSREKNTWIGPDEVRIYVRKSKRFIEGKMKDCLDIATISIEPGLRGKGLFGEIVKTFEELSPFEYLMIESIVNDRLLEHIKRSGNWKPYMNSEDTFIKETYTK